MMVSTTGNYLVRVILLLTLSGVGSTPAYAARSVAIQDIPPTPHSAPAGTRLADLAAAIKLAAGEEDWRVILEAPGTIQSSRWTRTHKAVVTIGFDKSNFWIEYKDSFNLGYQIPKEKKMNGPRRAIKGPRIQPIYNRWVDQLAKTIADELGKIDTPQ